MSDGNRLANQPAAASGPESASHDQTSPQLSKNSALANPLAHSAPSAMGMRHVEARALIRQPPCFALR